MAGCHTPIFALQDDGRLLPTELNHTKERAANIWKGKYA